jgi:hypothetical protein
MGGRGGAAVGERVNSYYQQAAPAAPSFGKDVRYESVFQQNTSGR